MKVIAWIAFVFLCSCSHDGGGGGYYDGYSHREYDHGHHEHHEGHERGHGEHGGHGDGHHH